ncbi:reverse transcriptase domain-containing protein [Tanacetum coccineum]
MSAPTVPIPSQPTSAVRNTVGKGNEQNLENLSRSASDATLQEYCEKYYHQLLPIIAEKVHQKKVQHDKLKVVKSHLNFEGCSGRNSKIQEVSQYSESRTPNIRGEHGRRQRINQTWAGGKGRKEGGVFNWLRGKVAAKVERWAMSTWCHMFNSTLTRSARKCIKDLVEIHHIKQREGESMEDFVQIFKTESRHVKGAPECKRISGFMHGITNAELIKRMHDIIPKSVNEMMRTITAFLKGEVAASNQVRKKTLPTWKQQEAGRKQNFDRRGDFRNQQRSERGRDKFTLLTKSPKQIEELIKAGKLSHVIKKLKQGSGKDHPKAAKKGEASGKDKAMAILMVQPWHRVARKRITQRFFPGPEISFPPLRDEDGGSASEILYEHCFNRLCPEERIKVTIHPEYPEQTIAIGSTLMKEGRKELCSLLRRNLDIFTWKPADMTGVPRHIAEHRVNVHEGCPPVRQKKRSQALERNKAIQEEVKKLVDVGIMKEVHYHSWLSNLIMNARATYQRLVDKAFQKQISRNLEVYVDELCSKKSDFHWTTEAEAAFKQMKNLIAELPTLTAPMEEKLIVYFAAAREVVTSVLMTESESRQMPICFVSRPYKFDATNNEAEYEALIAGLRILEQMGIQNLQAHQVPRSENKKADALSKIASTSFAHLTKQVLVEVPKENSINETKALAAVEEEGTEYPLVFRLHQASARQWYGRKSKQKLGRRNKGMVGYRKQGLDGRNPACPIGHPTMIKSSNGDTPFSLMYVTEALILAKIGMRTAEIDMAQDDEALELNLDLLEEKREQPSIHEARSKAKMDKYYNSNVRNTSNMSGDLVYRSNDASHAKDGGKLGPKWKDRIRLGTKSSKGSRKISPPFASSPDTTQKSNYILYLFSFVSKLGGYQLLPRKNKRNDYVSLKGTPISVAWPHSDTITASTYMFVRLVLQTDAAIMMLLDKLGPTPSHVTATKRIAEWYPVGKGQPHIVHGKLEQGGSAAPLLARDTKTKPGGFAYVKEVVKIRYGKMARKHIRHNEQGINDDLYAFVQKPVEDGRQLLDFKGSVVLSDRAETLIVKDEEP